MDHDKEIARIKAIRDATHEETLEEAHAKLLEENRLLKIELGIKDKRIVELLQGLDDLMNHINRPRGYGGGIVSCLIENSNV